MDLFRFCSLRAPESAELQRRVDFCAQLGRSYEFSRCSMPAGCRPARSDLGFWRQERFYFFYLRPAVVYEGTDSRLSDFFRSPIRRFDSFPALTRCLAGLLPPREAPPELPDGFRALRAALQSRIVGQDAAVEAAAFKLFGHICKKMPARPLSLIFYGPTCVGKSELGKAVSPALNQYLGRERYRLVWTELNTFTEAHSAYRLTGAPPGYAGYDDTPILEAVRQHPWTVFMFDELDKAHPEVLKVFMSILDEGRCAARTPDKQGGRELDFRRCVFLFTTNTDLSASGRRRLGFFPGPQDLPPQKSAAGPAGPSGLAQRLFQADESARRALVESGVLREIAGRFSGLIGFQPLSPAARQLVTARQIAALGREYGLEILQVSPGLAQSLTPADALSLRSTAGILEGVFTPLFLAQARRGPGAFRLAGTADSPVLLPAAPAGA